MNWSKFGSWCIWTGNSGYTFRCRWALDEKGNLWVCDAEGNTLNLYARYSWSHVENRDREEE